MKTAELILAHSTFVRTIPKNKRLHFPRMAKYVYYLKEGFVKIVAVHDDGREAIKYLLQAGSLFGESNLLSQPEHSDDYAVALEECVIAFIDTDKMKQCSHTYPDIRAIALQQVSNRLQKAERRLLSMTFKNASQRICEFLREFSKEFGKPDLQAYEVKSFLTHDDIAKLTATSRQTVSSILNELRDQKYIEYNNEVLRIPFASALWQKNT